MVFETRQPPQGLAHTLVETPSAYTTYMVSICNGSVERLWSDLGVFQLTAISGNCLFHSLNCKL